MSQPDDVVAVQLLAILNDADAPEGDQLDAAMDLEDHSGAWFASVLAQVCAAALAGIWARQGRIDQGFFPELHGQALREVLDVLGDRAPHLIPAGTGED
jgi:hypothetical protein